MLACYVTKAVCHQSGKDTPSIFLLEITYSTSPARRKSVFSTITFTQSFYRCQTQSQYTSLFWVIFMMPISSSHDRDRRQSKFGRMTLRGETPRWFIGEVKNLLYFLQTCFPLLLCCRCSEPTHWWRQDLCMLEAEVFYLFMHLCSFCAMQPAVLWRNTHYSELLDSILFLLSIDSHKTASSSLITTRKSSTNGWRQESWDYPSDDFVLSK